MNTLYIYINIFVYLHLCILFNRREISLILDSFTNDIETTLPNSDKNASFLLKSPFRRKINGITPNGRLN